VQEGLWRYTEDRGPSRKLAVSKAIRESESKAEKALLGRFSAEHPLGRSSSWVFCGTRTDSHLLVVRCLPSYLMVYCMFIDGGGMRESALKNLRS